MLAFFFKYISILVVTSSFCFAQQPNNKGSIFISTEGLVEKNQTEEALQITLRQIELATKNSSQKAKWLQLAGIIFKKNGELDTSLQYFKKSYSINKKINDSLSLMLNHLYLGQVFHARFDNLYKDRFSSKATQFKDSASFYYLKNITSFKNVKNGFKHKASSHNNLSYLYSDTNELEKAQNHITKAIDIYNKNLDEPDAINTYLNNQGLIYIYQKKYKKAEKVHLEVLQKKLDTVKLKALEHRLIATGNLLYIYQQTQQYKKALNYSLKYNEISDQIATKIKATEIRTIEAKYNVDKARQEEQLKTLEVEKKQQRTQSVAIIGGLIALSIILFGSVLYRNSKLKQKNLSLSLVQQELNKQQEIRLLQQQTQSKVLNATLDGREKERKDIAQTLHDSVSALLSSANMHLQVIKKKTKGEIDEVNKSQRIIDEASDKVRDLSHKLISAVLLKFGIEHAVFEMCEKYSNQELSFELESEDPIPRFPEEFEVKINNILEEFINNILKHSKASEGVIRLNYNNNILYLLIKDNGIGFDTSKINPKAGIGLSQIKARIENMCGEIMIESTSNQGTTIHIKVPTPKTIDK